MSSSTFIAIVPEPLYYTCVTRGNQANRAIKQILQLLRPRLKRAPLIYLNASVLFSGSLVAGASGRLPWAPSRKKNSGDGLGSVNNADPSVHTASFSLKTWQQVVNVAAESRDVNAISLRVRAHVDARGTHFRQGSKIGTRTSFEFASRGLQQQHPRDLKNGSLR